MNITKSNGVTVGSRTPPRRTTRNGLQQYTRNPITVQPDWKLRALRAYRAGQLDEYETRRIFRLHFEDFNPMRHVSEFIPPILAGLLKREVA